MPPPGAATEVAPDTAPEHADPATDGAAPLGHLPALLRDEPALAALAQGGARAVAVPDAARALTIAGLAHLTARRPVLVAVPTQNEAERLAADLRQFLGGFLGGGRPEGGPVVESFPAWETLPFERVSPNVETMGRRLRVMWRLRT